MKTILHICLPLMVCTLFACSNKKESVTPEVLEGKKVDVASLRKKNDNLLQSLYDEMVSKSDTLKQLEKGLAAVEKDHANAIAAYEDFNSKNINYYYNAIKAIDGLSDSLLRIRMRALIDSSQDAYYSLVAPATLQDSLLKKKVKALEDWHTILKISRTLPVIERYQQDHLPAAAPLETMVHRYDSVIQYMDSLLLSPDTTTIR